VDEITFRAPFGVLGRIAEGLVLRRYLIALIRERNRSLAAELGNAGTGTSTGTGTGSVGQGPASSPSVS